MTRHSSHPKALSVVAVACALMLSACGSDISHDRVVAAAGLQGSSQQGGSSGTGTGSDGTAGTADRGGVTQDPGSSGGGSSSATTGAAGSIGVTGSTGSAGSSTGSTKGTAPSGSAGSSGSTGSPSRPGTAGSASTSGCGKGTGTIKLGNTGPYSATAAGSTASPSRDILKVWQAEVNAHGGICGRKVEVLIRDNKGNTSEDAADVKDLVENQHVVAFVGNTTSLTVGGQQSYLEGKKIPVIGGDVVADVWFDSPVYFPQAANASEVNYAHLKSIQSRPSGTKLAFLYCAEFAACSQGYNAFVKVAKRAGTEIVYQKKVSLTAISFASECQEAKKAGAGAIYAGGDATFVNRVANSCGQQGLTFDYLVNGSSVGADQQDNQYLNNHMFVATPQQAWTTTSSPGAKLFSDSIARYGPNVAKTGNSIETWTAAILAQHALETIGDKPVNAASVLAAIRAVKGYDNMGLSGAVSFSTGKQKTNRCTGAVQLVNGEFVSVNDGKLSCRAGAPLEGVGSA
jgi:branched-chain amino acid transport system substrate-binding protein